MLSGAVVRYLSFSFVLAAACGNRVTFDPGSTHPSGSSWDPFLTRPPTTPSPVVTAPAHVQALQHDTAPLDRIIDATLALTFAARDAETRARMAAQARELAERRWQSR